MRPRDLFLFVFPTVTKLARIAGVKIGIFTPYLDTLTGGEKYILTAAECLSQQHSVSIFWDDTTILKNAEKKFNLDLSKVQLRQNIFTSKTPLLKRLSESKMYDAIIFLSDGSLPLVLSKKLIIHFQFPVEWVHADALINKIKFARTYKFFCNSQFTKHYIDKKFHTDSLVIYPPIDLPISKEVKKENVILTVGRYGYLPNGKNFKKHDIMIEAFKKMVDAGLKNWEFIIAISYFDKDKDRVKSLKDMTKGYPIHFVENVFSVQLSSYYQKAKIYWHASGYGEDVETHPDYAEHFGMSTVEAMSYGVVPIVINAGGQKEIITDGENGLLWNTEKELIEKTKQVMSNPGLQNLLIKGAKLRAKNFSKEKFCKEILELVE